MSKLYPRYQQTVDLAAEGLSNKEIAYRMGITEGTVKVYLSIAFGRLGINSRYELMAKKFEEKRLKLLDDLGEKVG